jgi:hypothetical protein
MTKFKYSTDQDYRNVLAELKRLVTPADSIQRTEQDSIGNTQLQSHSSSSNSGINPPAEERPAPPTPVGLMANNIYGNSVFNGPVQFGNTYGSTYSEKN